MFWHPISVSLRWVRRWCSREKTHWKHSRLFWHSSHFQVPSISNLGSTSSHTSMNLSGFAGVQWWIDHLRRKNTLVWAYTLLGPFSAFFVRLRAVLLQSQSIGRQLAYYFLIPPNCSPSSPEWRRIAHHPWWFQSILAGSCSQVASWQPPPSYTATPPKSASSHAASVWSLVYYSPYLLLNNMCTS